VRLVIRQDRFARCKPVVTQNKIRGKAIGSAQREVRVVNTVIGGDMEVGGGDLGTRNPKRTWKVKSVNELGRFESFRKKGQGGPSLETGQ